MALATMGGFFGQAVTQELVSRLFSCVAARRQERASVGDADDTLEKAHTQMQLALEISGKLPITDVSLLLQRRKIKLRFQECDMLLRSKQPPVQALLYDDQPTQQVVRAAEAEAPPGTEVAALTETEAVVAGAGDLAAAAAVTELLGQFCYSFLPVVNIARGAVRSVSSSLGITTDDELSLSNDNVKRFKGFTEKADKFIMNLHFSYSLRVSMIFEPLIRELLEGKQWQYDMVEESRNQYQHLLIIPVNTEEHGVLAALGFRSYDVEVPTKCFQIHMLLRLSESTNIVRIVKECLESLGPHFESSAQVAIGELSQLPTPLHMSDTSSSEIGNLALLTSHLYKMRPEPVCCLGNDKVIPSLQDSYGFPEEVFFVSFDCNVSAIDQYNEGSPTDEAEINIGWPLLKVQAVFKPHFSEKGEEIGVWHNIAAHREDMNGTSPQQVGEMVLTNAINCFTSLDEPVDYALCWISPHGGSTFAVKLEKPLTEDQRQHLFSRRRSQVRALVFSSFG